MQLPITIGLHRSRFLDLLILASALLGSLEAWHIPAPQYARLGFAGMIWGVAAWAWLRLRPPFRAVRLERDGGISVLRRDRGDYERTELLPGATVHPWLGVVRLRTDDGRRRYLIVAADAASPEDFRRLRVFLRWRADFSEASGDGA